MANQPGSSGRDQPPMEKGKQRDLPRKGEERAPSKETPKGGQTPQGGHR